MRGGKKVSTKQQSKLPWILLGIAFLLFFMFMCSGGEVLSGNVALIKVEGVILTSAGDGLFAEGISSAEIVRQINLAKEDSGIQAILVEINSPGGSAVASQEIGDALKSSTKPTASYIRDAGASGGYWVASATDQIFASPLSIVGSVGVTAAQLEYAGLLERFNISYRRTTAGKFKDIGTPFREQTEEEEDRLDVKLSLLHDYFIEEVRVNRDLSDQVVAEISQADFYVGIQAMELGLIDSYGGRAEAVSYLEEQMGGSATLVDYSPEPTLLDVLTGVLSEKDIVLQADVGSGGISFR